MRKKITLNPSNVFYDDLSHTYILGDKFLKGITGTLIERAYPDTYSGVSEAVLAHAAEKGHKVHDAIENAAMAKEYGEEYESVVKEAMELLFSAGLFVIAVEYVVSDGEEYASPIDLVAVDKDDYIYIIDIKTTSRFMREHVTLQTNIYQKFFLLQNPHLKVGGRFCLWLHVDEDYNVIDKDLYALDMLPDGFVDKLIEADKADEPFDVTEYYGNLPQKVKDVQLELKKLQQDINKKTEEMEKIKSGLLALMIGNNVKSFSSDVLSLTRVDGGKTKKFDSKKFKLENPDLYAKYQKESVSKPYIKIIFKNKENE